tara:strand:+ start:140 stop:289 length:150 start_codon:yes stop_codon:yes gene_type:complete
MFIMKNKKKKTLPRNWFAVHAHNRTGAGNHGDKKKEQSKKACRKYKWRG